MNTGDDMLECCISTHESEGCGWKGRADDLFRGGCPVCGAERLRVAGTFPGRGPQFYPDPRPWMIGAHGEKIMLGDPDRTLIYLRTIAYTLAHVNRFGGHARPAYAVAPHSLHVASLMRHLGPEAEAVGLMHDAHEAYTGDCPTPIKAILGGVWRRFEEAWAERVRVRFGLFEAFARYETDLRHYDLVALATERRDVLPSNAPEWDLELPPPDSRHVSTRSPAANEAFFLAEAARLRIA